jgi:hypothetical protein
MVTHKVYYFYRYNMNNIEASYQGRDREPCQVSISATSHCAAETAWWLFDKNLRQKRDRSGQCAASLAQSASFRVKVSGGSCEKTSCCCVPSCLPPSRWPDAKPIVLIQSQQPIGPDIARPVPAPAICPALPISRTATIRRRCRPAPRCRTIRAMAAGSTSTRPPQNCSTTTTTQQVDDNTTRTKTRTFCGPP